MLKELTYVSILIYTHIRYHVDMCQVLTGLDVPIISLEIIQHLSELN